MIQGSDLRRGISEPGNAETDSQRPGKKSITASWRINMDRDEARFGVARYVPVKIVQGHFWGNSFSEKTFFL